MVPAGPLTAAELGRLVDSLGKPTALIELAVLASCLVLAAAIVALLRGRRRPAPGSAWFGDRVVDGALFPLLQQRGPGAT